MGKWKYQELSLKMKTVKDLYQKQFERGYKNHGFKV